MPDSADDRIHRIAVIQHGVVSRTQLLDAGLSSRQIERRLTAGRLLRLHRGIYLPRAFRGALRPRLAPQMAAVLACGPSAVLSHRSAALLWGLLPRAGRLVELTVPSTVRRVRPGLDIHRARDLTPSDRTLHRGIPITTPARTLRDLSSRVGSSALARAVARAERQRLLDSRALATLTARHAGRPGAPKLRAAAGPDGARAFTRSEAEDRFLALVRSGGLTEPVSNSVLLGYEVDFFWPDARFVVEVDGFRYHGSRPAFENDRRRDTRLVAGGYRVMRLSWRQIVEEPLPTLVAVTRALDQGRVTQPGRSTTGT